MKISRLLLLWVFALGPAILAAATTARLQKADEILLQAEVVTTSAIGYDGACPEANWALSVIAESEEKPAEHLLEIADDATLPGTLMCIAGIKVIDEATFMEHIAEWEAEAKEGSAEIQIQDGCIVEMVSVSEALARIKKWPPSAVLRVSIPSLEQTVRPRKMANRVAGGN